ncbi:MAG: bifunctional diaminohydroxyphosphoribosylaminopyrimidine deaminase/5-amino-6-(5-phosphoribosylamino)uracil reductase RibD [Blastocatellales bacterium]|nr:bifunctional diaminohydroxyphosphoribosylaminopyrimidine deaminase/5-amino-6-(5-phosphoribosylamino)uracil reductase RibD [Blastocatellales bacterium]
MSTHETIAADLQFDGPPELMNDLDYLQLALKLAAQGVALASPNPLVGSVVVRDGGIVGRGFHRYLDLKHAEVWALEEAGERARGSTVYVNLEPCCHRGEGKRTSPCVQALINAGVARVVASMLDPNPRVNGRGFSELQAAGIEVSVGGFEKDARRLNEKYIKFVTSGLPFIHLKLASSLDGRIATRTGDSRWVTGEEAREASQRLRHEYDAILIGIRTALLDDPLLTDRTGRQRRRALARFVLDAGLNLPVNSQLVRSAGDAPLIVFSSSGADSERRKALHARGVETVDMPCADGRLSPAEVFAEIARRDLTSVVVEGGSEVAGSLIAERLIDKLTIFYAPKIIGGRAAVPSIGGQGIERMSEALQLDEVDITCHGADWEITGYPVFADEEPEQG